MKASMSIGIIAVLFCVFVPESVKSESKYCAELHPEAKYMTPPDSKGTRRWEKKPLKDFRNFAECFNRRFGTSLLPRDFRPCNSIPGLSERNRIKCIKNKPRLMSWCFRRGCADEISVLSEITTPQEIKKRKAQLDRADSTELKKLLEENSAKLKGLSKEFLKQFEKPRKSPWRGKVESF